MKVKVKKSDYQSTIARVGIILIMGIFSFYAITSFLDSFDGTIDSFMTVFAEDGFLLLIGIVFFVFEVLFIYYLIKAPKKICSNFNKQEN